MVTNIIYSLINQEIKMKKKLLLITSLLIILLSKNGFATAEIPSTEGSSLKTHRAAGDQDSFIILNRNFSFNIPLVKLVNNNGVTSYYDVDFIFLPKNSKNNRLLFGVMKAIGIERSRIDALDLSNAIILNRDLSFNIPSIRYVDVDDSIKYYNADFIYTPINNKLIFEVAKVIELQVSNENSTDCRSRVGKIDCGGDYTEVIDKTIVLAEATLEGIRSGANKNVVLELFQTTKNMARKIESTVTYSLRERALGRLKKARNAFESDEIELAEEYMIETVEMFKALKDKYLAFT
jgi:hypothetical protein